MSASLLVELFTEELPPKALARLGGALEQQILAGLGERGLLDGGHTSKFFATPRRLAVHITRVLALAPDRTSTRKLMPSKVAFDAGGKPTAALLKRLEKENARADQVTRRVDGKDEYVFLELAVAGSPLAAGLQAALEHAIARLPIPKVMSYQLADGATTVQFVRPVHGLVALHGGEVVAISLLGLKADRITHGHRFQGVADISVASADAYEEALAAHGKVIASFAARREQIRRELDDHAAKLDATLGPDADRDALLDEVCALVEYPTVYVGEFESEYLAVPQECLILTMRQNQKYFPLFDARGKLISKFLIVSNMKLADPRNIIEGNQRVIRPRLADARFFFEFDKKTRLEDRVPRLAAIVYHNKLGNQLERTTRVQLLAGRIARSLGDDPVPAERAAWLAKADLVTSMVGEFPELQGIMGRYYALADGEHAAVADAVEQHYKPRFAGDTLPASPPAIAVALADKLESMCGLFGIGQIPSGDKDPYALRRHALGVVRILVEKDLRLALNELIDMACGAFPGGMLEDTRAALRAFVLDRLRAYLRDADYTSNEIESVLSVPLNTLNEVPRQLAAVRAFCRLPEADSLAAANKRVANILRQAASKGESFDRTDAGKLAEPAERALFDALSATSLQATALFQQGDFTGYLRSFSVLKAPVDAFFDTVMVMVDAAELRRNRLALLSDLRHAMNRIADISKLAA